MATLKIVIKTDRELAEIDHKYKLLNGQIAINVTAISGLMDDGKSGAMAGSAAKLTREGLNYRQEWNAKRDRGTRVHNVCELFLKGQDADVQASDSGFVDALEMFLRDKEPTVLELEQIALSEKGYGGRFDMIVRWGNDNWLLDLKTGSEYAIEHTLQLSAYRYADGIAVYDENGALVDLRPLPKIDRCGCLYVREDGTYKVVEYPADEQAFGIFNNLLTAYQWTRSEEMKTLVKESKAK